MCPNGLGLYSETIKFGYILSNTLRERLSGNKRKAPDCESSTYAHLCVLK